MALFSWWLMWYVNAIANRMEPSFGFSTFAFLKWISAFFVSLVVSQLSYPVLRKLCPRLHKMVSLTQFSLSVL